VSRDSLRDGKVFLHFQVADTGPGIPNDKLGVVFDAFSQADSSIARRFGGTGLGLAICRHLVVLMGGRIWAESGSSRGSIFHFTAGFGRCSEPVLNAAPSAEPPVKLYTGRRLRILIGEDNPINQKLLSTLLIKAGHVVETAVNGTEVIAKLAAGPFDIVLMDVEMPEVDGLEATRRIRAGETSAAGHIPIVGVTAAASGDDMERCMAAGMNACVTKPIQLPRLADVLARISAGKPIEPLSETSN